MSALILVAFATVTSLTQKVCLQFVLLCGCLAPQSNREIIWRNLCLTCCLLYGLVGEPRIVHASMLFLAKSSSHDSSRAHRCPCSAFILCLICLSFRPFSSIVVWQTVCYAVCALNCSIFGKSGDKVFDSLPVSRFIALLCCYSRTCLCLSH